MRTVATDMLAFHGACAELYRFSLMQRDPQSRLLRIHRLVQAILKETMEIKEQQWWVEHMIRTTERMFPATVDVTTWSLCQRMLPQAQMGSLWAERFAMASPQAASLLRRTAHYLRVAALHGQAKQLSQQVMGIRSRMLKQERLEIAQSLHALAGVHRQQGRYAEAEPLYQRALAIWEQHLGSDHPQVAHPLTGLALLYELQGTYEEAEPLYRRALAIVEQHLGSEHPQVAEILHDFATLQERQGHHLEALALYQRALAIRDQALGSEHPKTCATREQLTVLRERVGHEADAPPEEDISLEQHGQERQDVVNQEMLGR